MNQSLEEIQKQLNKIQQRNKKVELDKKWEQSITRKFIISIITYFVISLFLLYIKIEKPFINSIVPTIGFALSTLTLNIFKKLWIKKQ